MARTVLIVDDEQKLCDVVALFLRAEGIEALTANTGEDALALLAARPVDLVVLDVMLPGMDGFEVCRRVRACSDVPILFLSALSDEDYFVLGYRAGADDYIAKPFKVSILTLKIRRMLETRAAPAEKQAAPGGIALDEAAHRCTVDGRDVYLTHKEFQMLALFLRLPGRVLTRESLLREIWGYDFAGESRVVDTHVKQLRRKLGPYASCIRTVIGTGYRFEAEP